MNRRLVIFAGAAIASTIVAAANMIPADVAPQRPNDVTLIYIGADDCAPCRVWQRDAEGALRSSPRFARLNYRAVKSPTLFDLLGDEHWPPDLRGYRDRLGAGAGAPTWLIIADGALVTQASGAGQWRETVLPRLETLLR